MDCRVKPGNDGGNRALLFCIHSTEICSSHKKLVGDGTHSVQTATARVSRCALPFLNRDDPRRTGGQRPGWHAPIGWEKRPSVIQEIAVAQERLHDIAMAIPRGCQKIWTLGNHDARFETRLATVAQGIKSYRLTPLFDSGVNCYGC
jgi:hypothetical protein